MSNYNFNNVKFEGNSNHFGDVYSSYGDFLDQNESISELGKDVAKVIFQLDKRDIDRELLLKTLQKLEKEENPQISPEEKGIWKKFRDKLIDEGLDESVKKIKLYLTQTAPTLLAQIFSGFNG